MWVCLKNGGVQVQSLELQRETVGNRDKQCGDTGLKPAVGKGAAQRTAASPLSIGVAVSGLALTLRRNFKGHELVGSALEGTLGGSGSGYRATLFPLWS